MKTKPNKFLVEYAFSQLGNPYWYGTYGQIASLNLLKEKRSQFKSRYTASDFKNQFGKRVHDCVGLIKGASWSETFSSKPKYDTTTDVSANGLMNLCKEKGPVEKIQEMPGLIVWKTGHVGIYIGNKTVIEARGHAWGVVQTKIDERPWEMFGKCPWFEYKTIGDFVKRLYDDILDRDPDHAGKDFWENQILSDNMTPSEAILEFFESPEFESRKIETEEFIMMLYDVFFDRKPDSGGFDFWKDYVQKYGRRATILEFEKSEEWKRDEAVLRKTKL
jgi:hypothetical protein